MRQGQKAPESASPIVMIEINLKNTRLFGFNTVILAIIILVLIILRIINSKDIKADNQRLENEKRALEEAERKRKAEQEELIRQQKIEKEKLYGPLTRQFGGFWRLPHIQIYDEKDVIFIGDRELKYNMILGYTLSDNSHTITQGGNMQAKTSTGNMIGRGIVGGVLLGGVGALAGAATAKKNIQTEASITTTKHSYKIHIDIASPTDPLLTVECGDSENYARDLAATLNYIIHKNNS